IDTPPPPPGDITWALAAKGAKLTVKLAKNKAKPTYQWLLNDIPINEPAARKATYTAKKDGLYSVRVTNPAGTTERTIANIKLITPPKIASITASRTNIVAGAGEPVTFTATLQDGTGTPPLTWTWLLDGKTPLATHTTDTATDTLTLTNITKAGKYTVQVTNGAGKVTGKAKSKTIAIKVIEPPTITQQPAGLTLVEGKPVKLAVKATGTARLTYQWYWENRDGKTAAIPGATKAALSLKTPKGTSITELAGHYWVVVDNPANRPVPSRKVTLAAPATPATAINAATTGTSAAKTAPLTATATAAPSRADRVIDANTTLRLTDAVTGGVTLFRPDDTLLQNFRYESLNANTDRLSFERIVTHDGDAVWETVTLDLVFEEENFAGDYAMVTIRTHAVASGDLPDATATATGVFEWE
ncbi:MAG: immunoglobulin domain-containing protein, partial [Opitutaceae bacterium]|nr:immunoglobulin domain-containing protein [Opitutaceae bacterium]